MKLDDLSPKHRAQAVEQLSLNIKGRTSGKAPEPKCDSNEALENSSSTFKIDRGVYLVVLMYRTRNLRWDLDNAYFKPFLDSLVQNKILEDDSVKQIEGLIKLPRKVKTKAEERTVLEFWDADYLGGKLEKAMEI